MQKKKGKSLECCERDGEPQEESREFQGDMERLEKKFETVMSDKRSEKVEMILSICLLRSI